MDSSVLRKKSRKFEFYYQLSVELLNIVNMILFGDWTILFIRSFLINNVKFNRINGIACLNQFGIILVCCVEQCDYCKYTELAYYLCF